MAQNTTVALTPFTWTQLTNADATAIRVQTNHATVYVQATAGAVAPTSTDGAVILHGFESITADYALKDIWPGVVGTRVYAYSEAPDASVSFSHA